MAGAVYEDGNEFEFIPIFVNRASSRSLLIYDRKPGRGRRSIGVFIELHCRLHQTNWVVNSNGRLQWTTSVTAVVVQTANPNPQPPINRVAQQAN
jgi:hypothetical protein